MDGAGRFIGGAILVVIGIFGLAFSARAVDSAFSIFGMLIFGFAVLMLFRLIAISIDSKESA